MKKYIALLYVIGLIVVGSLVAKYASEVVRATNQQTQATVEQVRDLGLEAEIIK